MERRTTREGYRDWPLRFWEMGRAKKAGKPKASKRAVEEPGRSATLETVEVVPQENETVPETQQGTREGEDLNELENEEVQTPNDDIAFEEDVNLNQGAHSTGGGSSVQKKNGRGHGIGVKPGHGLHLEIHDNRIVTPQAAHELTAIFKRGITGPWIKFSEYPASALQTVIARFKESGFTCSLPEEELNVHLKEHIKRNFSQWMYGFRNRVFNQYPTLAERINNPPTEIPAHIWREMVNKWSDPNWKSTSDKNKANREKSELTATGGSVPMAKFRLDQIKKTGKEPDPIETFKKFHVKKGNGEFTTPKAQTIHAELKNKEAEKLSQGEEVNQFAIYGEVVGKQPRKRVLGMGYGVTGVDVFGPSSGQGCSKRCEEDRRQEKVKNDEMIRMLKEELVQVKNGIPQIVEDTLKRLGVNLAESSMAGDKEVNDEDEDEDGDEEVNDEDADGFDHENSSP
ncbi:unnamed protein product [Linum tenue]|uniref:Transposase, Ptta/En/Spm, plant n=1 Tax=Linum tenue TaxID=586396 RepID=A0AAV0IQ50_9ROSI|nr:unnamed protein product [Linum tenue]